MKPDDFKTLINTIGNLIDKRAETTEVAIKLHVSNEITKSEVRIKEELRGEILAARAEAKADHLHLLGKMDNYIRSTNRRLENLENVTNTSNPNKH